MDIPDGSYPDARDAVLDLARSMTRRRRERFRTRHGLLLQVSFRNPLYALVITRWQPWQQGGPDVFRFSRRSRVTVGTALADLDDLLELIDQLGSAKAWMQA
jgi:hypothetical protein